jgi:hypothetical protein
MCGPRRWSTSCENQGSLSEYVTIIKTLGSWKTNGMFYGKSVTEPLDLYSADERTLLYSQVNLCRLMFRISMLQ